jgi:hypothetical protein
MKLFLLISAFCISYFSANAQNIDNNLQKFAQNYSSERIYIHFDKSTYGTGETIWFKCYIMNGIFPEEKSKSVYVDFTDSKGKLLQHRIAPVQDGTSFGQFDLPTDYDGRFIHVRAYTKWMLNFDSAFLFNKDLAILSKTKSPGEKKVVAELNFFPEGGDAIAGVSNKIAFKANDQFGRPVKIKGVIVNSAGKTLDSLKVIHDGMGYFYINPKAGETFSAKWKDENNVAHVTQLPAVKASGITLQVALNGTKRNFLVSATPGSGNDNSKVHLIGTMYQQPVFKIERELKSGTVQGIIPTEDLPSGILTITVFDNDWKPLAERITYVNNEEYRFYPEMTVQHWGLNKRAKNEIEIAVPDSLVANLSVSVTDLAIDNDTSDNIISHLLLTGELKGKVYDPVFYFQNTSDSISRMLDLVMLTHGWRRFNWENVLSGTFPEIKYPKDTSWLSVSGKIFGATEAQLRDAGSIVLFLNQDKASKDIFAVPINPDGSFNDPSRILFDTAQVYYQLPKGKGLGDVAVQFMQNRLPPLTNNVKADGSYYTLNSDTTGTSRHLKLAAETAEQLAFNKTKVLETVTVAGKTKSPVEQLDEKYASGLFSGGDGYQFDLLHDPFAIASIGIFQYLQGKVAGLQINTSSNPPSLSWRGGTPTIYLDEMPADAQLIENIPVSDIAYIKVLRPPFMGPSGGGGSGAIAIYTRRGNDVQSTSSKGLSKNTVSGYTAIREFYSPNYSSFSEENEKQDLRTTLYWNPAVITTPGNNKALLTFYNTDVTKAFRVVIEGMTKDGRLAHVVQVME